MPPDPLSDPNSAALAPLRQITYRAPWLEAQVIWEAGGDWAPVEDEEQFLDPEEVEPYAAGLLAEGFSLAYQALGQGGRVEFLRLFFWQGGTCPPLPADEDILLRGQISAGA